LIEVVEFTHFWRVSWSIHPSIHPSTCRDHPFIHKGHIRRRHQITKEQIDKSEDSGNASSALFRSKLTDLRRKCGMYTEKLSSRSKPRDMRKYTYLVSHRRCNDFFWGHDLTNSIESGATRDSFMFYYDRIIAHLVFVRIVYHMSNPNISLNPLRRVGFPMVSRRFYFPRLLDLSGTDSLAHMSQAPSFLQSLALSILTPSRSPLCPPRYIPLATAPSLTREGARVASFS
jgi:hypothetical protein